jgi:hypothetical protein
LLLNILNDLVIEPTVVKTVSKDNVSALVYNLASGLVIKDSFLQDVKMKIVKRMKIMGFNY